MKRALLSAALALGCTTPLTQVMVVLDSDLTPGLDVDTVRVVVSRVGRDAPPSHDVLYDLRSGRFTFPGTLAVVARDPEDDAPLRVQVTAARAGRTLLGVEATATAPPYTLSRLDVFLPRRCLDPRLAECPAGTTCGAAGCVPVAREALPTYSP